MLRRVGSSDVRTEATKFVGKFRALIIFITIFIFRSKRIIIIILGILSTTSSSILLTLLILLHLSTVSSHNFAQVGNESHVEVLRVLDSCVAGRGVPRGVAAGDSEEFLEVGESSVRGETELFGERAGGTLLRLLFRLIVVVSI